MKNFLFALGTLLIAFGFSKLILALIQWRKARRNG